MNEDGYLKKIAILESLNDQLQAEFAHLDILLRKIGFDGGIHTLKEAAGEILEKSDAEESD
jgi:hypothetical protein